MSLPALANQSTRINSLISANLSLSTEVQISKLPGVRDIIGLFQSSLFDSKILGDNNRNRSEALRVAAYQQLKRLGRTPDGTVKSQEFAISASTSANGLPQFQLLGESTDSASEELSTKSSFALARYLDFICSLLNAPEHLLRPQALLYERVHEGKLFVDRVDVLQVPDIESGVVIPTADADPTAISNASVHQGIPSYQNKQLKSVVFMREELSIDPRLVEAVKNCAGLSRGTSALDPVLLHEMLGQLPESVRTVVRKKVNTLGLVEVDSIAVDLKSSGVWNNTIIERNIIEAKPLGPAVTEKEFKRTENIPDALGMAIRSMIYKRKEAAPHNKTIGFYEVEDGETTISALNPLFSGKPSSSTAQIRVPQVGPLSVTLETFDLKKSNALNYEESGVKYNFMMGTIDEMKAREEFVEPGNKIKINTVVLKNDMSSTQLDSLTIPKLTSWDSTLTLFGLFGVFPLKHAEMTKADYFVRKRNIERAQDNLPAGSVVYELVKFIYSIEGSQLIIVERSIFPKENDPFVKQVRGRGTDTFALTEDDIYSKMAGISPPKDSGKQTAAEGKKTPFDSLVQQSALAERGPLKSAKSGLFDNVGKNLIDSFDDSDGLGDFDDEDSVVVNKSMNTLGRFSEGIRRNDNLVRISTPLIAVLKALEQAPANETKDCMLVQLQDKGNCVFESVKPAADPRVLDVNIKITTENEVSVFKPIQMIMERFCPPEPSKTVYNVTPDSKFTTLKSAPTPTVRAPALTSPKGTPSLMEILENLSKFVNSLKNPRFYLRVTEDSPQKTEIEVYEIIDQGREQIHERLEVPKQPFYDAQGEPGFLATRVNFTPEGQTEESIEFKLKSAGASQDEIRIADTKLKQTVPSKPYHNMVREKSRADGAGIRPTKVGQPVNTDAILDLLAKEAAINPQTSLIRQEVENDRKIIERWSIDPVTKNNNLAERFILKLADLAQSTTQEQSISQLPKYLIQPEKTPEGTLVIKVFKVVDEAQKYLPGNELAAPIAPAEIELWKSIKKVNDSKQPDERIPELKVPSATLLIKEYWMGRLGTVSHQIEKTVLPLGDIIGYTLDGQPIYKKQLRDSSVSPTSPIPTPAPAFKFDPIQTTPDSATRPALNRFDSMEINMPEIQPIKSLDTPHLGPKPAVPSGNNMFDSQSEDHAPPKGGSNAPDSSRTDPDEVARLTQENSRLAQEVSHLKSQIQPGQPPNPQGNSMMNLSDDQVGGTQPTVV